MDNSADDPVAITEPVPLGPARSADVHHLVPTRRDDGTWEYGGTGVEIPGAVDETLSEIVNFKVVAESDGTRVATLIARAEVDRLPDELRWVLSAGTRVRTDPEEEYEVPWATWQEHANAAVGVRAPDLDSTGLDQVLAIQEREFRFARARVDQLSAQRAKTIAFAAGLGRSRRRISKIVGVTPVRIAQIIEDISEVVRVEVEDLLGETVVLLRHISSREVEIDELTQSAGYSSAVLEELVAMGLLARVETRVRVTSDGESAELYLRSAMLKSVS